MRMNKLDEHILYIIYMYLQHFTIQNKAEFVYK